jgi:hypothetical protein
MITLTDYPSPQSSNIDKENEDENSYALTILLSKKVNSFRSRTFTRLKTSLGKRCIARSELRILDVNLDAHIKKTEYKLG